MAERPLPAYDGDEPYIRRHGLWKLCEMHRTSGPCVQDRRTDRRLPSPLITSHPE